MTDAMTVDSGAAPPELGLGDGTRHLIHCPPSWDHYLLDAPSIGDEHFVLTGELPRRHPLFNDGPAHFHDLQVTTETIREIGEFVGHRYFGVPADRPGLFYRFTLDLTELRAWRTADPDPGAGPDRRSRMTAHIKATPANLINGVPRGLDFDIEVGIDDIPCGRGTAGLVFLMPVLHRKHVAYLRQAVRAVPEMDDAPDTPPRPVSPAEVGRSAPGNVVVGEPSGTPDRLSTWVLGQGVSPVFAGTDGQVSGLHLLEALRQTSLLAAGAATGWGPPAACCPPSTCTSAATPSGICRCAAWPCRVRWGTTPTGGPRCR